MTWLTALEGATVWDEPIISHLNHSRRERDCAAILYPSRVESFAQTLAALMTAAVAGQLVGVHEFEWASALSVSALAAVYSLVSSIAAGTLDPETGASFGTTQPTAQTPDQGS